MWQDCWKKVIVHKMCVLISSTTFVGNIHHSKKNSARHYHKYAQVFMWSTHYYCQILMKLQFSWQIFWKKNPQTKISWKSIKWELSCSVQTDRWMDIQTDMMKLIITFAEGGYLYISATENVGRERKNLSSHELHDPCFSVSVITHIELKWIS